MRRPSRARNWQFAAAAAFALTLITATATAAVADTVGGAISGTNNSSDPEIFQCPNSTGTGTTLCMYTSHDIGSGALPNYYPMDKTFIYRLKDGRAASVPSNWVGTQIADEAQMPCGRIGFACGAHHLWAPGGGYYNGKYLLYLPDLMDTSADGQHTSSRIQVFSSTTTTGTSGWNLSGAAFMQNMPMTPNTGYASDPAYFADSDGKNYLLWANGDYSNCGGVSMGRLINDYTVANGSGVVWIVNWSLQNDNIGGCGGGTVPYVEGAVLYRTTAIGGTGPTYTMIFAAKPGNGNPVGCNSANEVIAYAQSNTVTGPYSYRGIIMCGSEGPDGGEWTNQASVSLYPANGKYVFAYHDGPHADGGATGWPNRKVHLQCLKWSAGKIVQIPRSTTNMSNC